MTHPPSPKLGPFHRLRTSVGTIAVAAGGFWVATPIHAGEIPNNDTTISSDVSSETAPPTRSLRAPDQATTRAALLLLNDAVTVQIDGKHHGLLRALRHLNSPGLAPLFEGLSREQVHPSLRVHGLLGLAEISPSRSLDASVIAEVQPRDVQAELISAALDGDLIDRKTAKQMLSWRGLDPAVKLLLAMPLVAAGEFDVSSPGYDDVVAALDSQALGQHGMAALLLHAMGDARGTQALDQLTGPAETSVDAVRAMLLEAAWAHGLTASASWAYDVAQSEGLPTRLEMLALRVAIRFGDERADVRWAEQFAAAEGDVSRRMWLSLAGLEVSPWLSASSFDALINADDAVIAQLGRTGKAVAHKREQINHAESFTATAEALLHIHHPRACQWAADYAQETGSADLAAAVVLGYAPGHERGRTRRLEAVAHAAQTWVGLAPSMMNQTLARAFESPDADPAWQRAVLLGLIRSQSEASRLIELRLGNNAPPATAALLLALKAQHPQHMSADDHDSFERVLRQAEGELDDSVRVQMAWAYLQHTGQADQAIAALLAPAASP